jgi:hypothetical protein
MKTNGPGKYDDECKLVMMSTDAQGVLVVVYHGDRGSGISFKTRDPDLMRRMPAMLEELAAQMRRDAQADAN